MDDTKELDILEDVELPEDIPEEALAELSDNEGGEVGDE